MFSVNRECVICHQCFLLTANVSYVINVLWIKSSSLICENEYYVTLVLFALIYTTILCMLNGMLRHL